MGTIGPVIGMTLLGIVVGWLTGRLSVKFVRFVALAVVAVIALQLIGFKIAALHWESLSASARAAAGHATSTAPVLWRLALYNLPFTAGFVIGLWRALPVRRRRK